MGPTLYEEGLIEGKKSNAEEIAKRMLKNGFTIEDIHISTEIPKNDILELKKTI